MKSKIDIRNDIASFKLQYEYTKDKSWLIQCAIYKGLYLAMGGQKGIPIPNKYDKIILYSKAIFKFKLNSCNKEKAYSSLYKSLVNMNKMPSYYLGEEIPEDNDSLAKALTLLITEDNTDDLSIRYYNIYSIVHTVLCEMEN